MTLDFDPATVPWTDRADFPEEFARRRAAGEVSEEQTHLLERWRSDGYLHLPAAVDLQLIDTLLQEYEQAWESRPDNLLMLVEGPGIQPWPEVAPRHTLDHHHYRLMDFQDASTTAQEILLDPTIVSTLRLLLGGTPVAMQSLFFEFGSEQHLHQDFPYVQAQILSHLVGCWIACEDVVADNGPLFYYPGSHRLGKFDWGEGALALQGQDEAKVARFEEYLQESCAAAGLERTVFQAKKGDVLFWHAALVHGGSPAHDRTLTRKSLVAHYSSRCAYPRDRRAADREPRIVRRNGGMIYQVPPIPLTQQIKGKVKAVVKQLLGR